MKTLNIAVAGCGPAGLASALLLSRDGHHVSVFERFDAPRPVGSGLIIQPTGLAVLRAMGLDQAVIAAGARINRLFGKAVPSNRTVLDVRYVALDRASFGVGIHRAALFDILFQAVRAADIPIFTDRTVIDAPIVSGDQRDIVFADGERSGPFDLIIDALGAASSLASCDGRVLAYGALWASLDWPAQADFSIDALEQRYVRASTMAGVMPIGLAPGAATPRAAFFWSLRADHLEHWRNAGLDAWKREVLRLWPVTQSLLDQITQPEQLTFARYAHRTVRAPAKPGLIHLGDAWHSTSPQLGQGANMALLDAFALSKALREAKDPSRAPLRAVALRANHVRFYQSMSSLFTPVYQSDSHVLPWLRDRIAGPVSKIWPANKLLAAMVSGSLGNPLKRLELDVPDHAREAAARATAPTIQ